jgi:hypothetical protein
MVLFFNVRIWFKPIARSYFKSQVRHLQQIQMIVDEIIVGFTRQL